MPRLSARLHLLGLIAVAVIPVWLFATYLLFQYAFNERDRFEREALQTARQVSLVVEGELVKQLTILEGLSKSTALTEGDLPGLHGEAMRLVQGTERIIALSEDGRRLIDTGSPYSSAMMPALSATLFDAAALTFGHSAISDAFTDPKPGKVRIAVALAVRGPQGQDWLLTVSVPTAHLRNVMAPAVPQGWVVAIGDRRGAFVARSQMHDEMSGKPGLPAYLAKVVGRSGTFTAPNFQGTTLLAGYYRSDFSGWFYSANVPLSVVRAPLWESLKAIGALAVIALAVSMTLAYVVGKGFASAAAGLAQRARAVGLGGQGAPIRTSVREFAVIGDALAAAERSLAERKHELETVIETVPAAVWFTYDPRARLVIRNRFAAELMGMSTEARTSFGVPDLVIDTLASKDGRTISRDDRPLTRAMRGESTDNEEYAYTLPSGPQRTLLTSARPILGAAGEIVGAVQISLDITERKKGEEQRKLLVNELNHRVKNTLAVVQSIASQTLRSAESLEAAERALGSRLVSLAKAHDVLTQESWSGADLKDLVTASLKPHADLTRFRISGEAVRLKPALALSLAMAMHELATNAIKYGALSVPDGMVSINWAIVDGENRLLHLEWRESGGPPVSPPVRRGFGTRMLERVFRAEDSGEVSLAFEPTGLVCAFAVALGADEAAIKASASTAQAGHEPVMT